MPRRRGSLRLLILLALVAALVVSNLLRDEENASNGGPDGFAEGSEAIGRVTDIVDGDTIEVRLEGGDEIEDVRYIGIDTPESVKPDSPVECGGPEASAANAALVEGREVLLLFDAEARDRYGRLLAYVYVDRKGARDPVPGSGAEPPEGNGLLVNAELVRQGWARTLEIAPNDSLASFFEELEAAAGRAGRGLWGRCGG